MTQIKSDIYIMTKPKEFESQLIEKELEDNFGEIVRWAITDIEDNCIKISVSYKKMA